MKHPNRTQYITMGLILFSTPLSNANISVDQTLPDEYEIEEDHYFQIETDEEETLLLPHIIQGTDTDNVEGDFSEEEMSIDTQ